MTKRGWLTPDISVLSNPSDCRKIVIQGDLWYYVQGALEELTKTYNWKKIGSATVEEMTQYFMDVLDDFSVSECGMEWFGVPFTLVSETKLWLENYGLTVEREDLPSEMQNANAMMCRVILRTEDSNFKIFRVDRLSSNQTMDWFRVFNQDFNNHFTVIAPVADGGVRFTLNEEPDRTVFWDIRVVGWWG